MKIEAYRGDYDVEFRESIGSLSSHLNDLAFDAVIYDSNLLELQTISEELFKSRPSFGIVANEKSKTFQSLSEILEWFGEIELNRGSTVLVIGGGVIQDIATFTCSIFHRGINWIYVPTTLLAQSDSSIGGKCGINLSQKKNQIGVVYPPNRIIVVHQFLNTLQEREVISGIGEIFKMSLTDKGQFWNEMKDYLDRGQTQLKDLVPLSLNAKKIVIEIDEFESNYRKVLNYGHTFGHAFEAASNYLIPHGIAVLLGMKVIHNLGLRWGVSKPEVISEVNFYIEKALAGQNFMSLVSKDQVFNFVKSDKKVRSGEITLILLEDIGKLKFIKKNLNSELESEILDAIDTL